ncbi:MAG: flavin reductase family protein [Deltaproteobacteria bacterium]|nr:flavin reductase family protein [Deltaproteobacteria bacterium]MBN2674020.1 flavin reductase family protein [Deltaproteobacteria bacterium]
MTKMKIHSNIHSLLNPGCVVWVSAGDGDNDSVFTVTWNMPVRRDPAMVAIECSRNHHTYQFIRRSGEFALNVPEARHVNQVLACGRVSGKTGVDKFEKFGLTRESAEKIKAPLVGEAFANLECRIAHVVDMGSSALLIAQVVSARVDERHFVDGKLVFDNGLELLHHLGGDRFCVSTQSIVGATMV